MRLSKSLIVLTLAVGLVSCSTVRVSRNHTSSRTDTVYIKQAEVVRDSVWTDRWHTIYTKGDTIYQLDSIIVDRWHYAKADTVLISSTNAFTANNDTIVIEKPTATKKSGWSGFCQGWTICSFVLIILGLVLFILRKLRVL